MLLPGIVAASVPSGGGSNFTPGTETFTVTYGNVAFDHGFNDGTEGSAFGSVAPTSRDGYDINAMFIQNLGIYFLLKIDGEHPQSSVTQVDLVTYETDLTFFQYNYDAGNGHTEWWYDASAYWDGTPSTNDVAVTFA